MKRISLILDANGDCALPSGLNPIRAAMVSVNAVIQGSTQLAAVLTNGAGAVVAEFNTLIVPTIGGSATSGDVETACMLIEYEDLGGMQGRYIGVEDLMRRQSGILTTVEIELTGSAAGWTGARAINAATNLLKAGREYAILGITSDTLVAAVSITGPCTGNYRYGLPGDPTQIERQSQGFVTASALARVPMIPVLNASDATSTQLAFCQDGNNVSPNVTMHLALLD